MNNRTDELMAAFQYGIDYGLLLAEQERDSEDLFDAVGCMVVSAKYGVPSAPARRRQPRSEAWRNAMAASAAKLISLVATPKQ